jgi:hypothetical protein
MTILSVLQDVASFIGVTVPNEVFASTVREHVELASMAQEMAERIASGHDWQKLSKVATITGDGSAEAFDLPSDYDRMLVKASVWSSSLETALSPITSLDKWLELDVQSFDFVINAWTIYAGQMNIKPALSTGATAKYFYQSDRIIAPATGANKVAFTADTDSFVLDERLLKLGVIWRWKEQKGQPYAECMADYEELKERLVVRDRGSRMMRIGRVRMPSDVTTAYPQAIEP